MARTAPALSARIAHAWGRGASSQSKAGGWTASIQGETEGAKKEEERKDKDGSNDSNDEKDQEEDNDSKSSSSKESETNEPSKPPSKIQASTKPSQDNINEGKEGTADDDDDDLFPRDVEACCKGCKKGGCPCKGTTGESCVGRLASQTARATEDFGTPQNCEHQAMFAQAYRTLVSRMFVSLGLADDIVDAIVDEQGYNTPHALSCLDKKGTEQLVNVIYKPGGMKGGTQNPRVNVPL